MRSFLHDSALALRATGVLVATLVGAGYASGREVSQYFGEASWGTVVLAAVLVALFSMAFLLVGARGKGEDSRWVRAYQWVLSILAVVSCGVMVAASKSLLGGGWTALWVCLAGVCVCFADKVFHAAGVLAVPVLLILVAIVAFRAPNVASGTAFLPLSAANYAGMNLLFEGELLRREGRGMSGRAILLAGGMIGVCMGALFAAMHGVVGASAADLPFADVAAALGLAEVANLVILISIVSSIAGGMRICLVVWRERMPAAVAALIATIVSLLVSVVSFPDLVRVVYPLMGWAGVAVVSGYAVGACKALYCLLCDKMPALRARMDTIYGKKGKNIAKKAY